MKWANLLTEQIGTLRHALFAKERGETQRFVRAPDCDKRVANGDDFAGDAWLDQETRQIVYGAVGHDRNAAANAEVTGRPPGRAE